MNPESFGSDFLSSHIPLKITPHNREYTLEDADARLGRYRPQAPNDPTVTIFKALLLYAPRPTGHRNIVQEICKKPHETDLNPGYGETDDLRLYLRASFFLDYLIKPCKDPPSSKYASEYEDPAVVQPVSLTATRDESFRDKLLRRDNYTDRVSNCRDMDRPRDLKEDGTLHNAFLEAAHILPFHYMAPPKSTSNISSIISTPSSSRSSSRRSSLRAPIVGYSPLSSPLEWRSSVQSASTGRSSNRSMPDIQNPSLTTATQTSKVNPIIKAKIPLFISSHANYVKWNSWHALLTFAGDHYAQNLVAATHMNAPHNGLLLQRDVHHLFNSLRGWLEPVDHNPFSDSHDYYWRQAKETRSLPGVSEGKYVNLKPHIYPDEEKRDGDDLLTPPSRYLLWLHGQIAQVFQMYAAGEKDPDIMRDEDEIPIRNGDPPVEKNTADADSTFIHHNEIHEIAPSATDLAQALAQYVRNPHWQMSDVDSEVAFEENEEDKEDEWDIDNAVDDFLMQSRMVCV